MHQKHLLRFIKSKLRKEPDEVVIFRDGKYLTLKEVRAGACRDEMPLYSCHPFICVGYEDGLDLVLTSKLRWTCHVPWAWT